MEIRFSSKSPDHGWLSNFDKRGSFAIDGEAWRTVEHYYQAHKFMDPELRGRIHAEETAIGAKKIAQNCIGEIRDDWDQMREAVMRTALNAKFRQNRALRKNLLETGGATLVHHSSSDHFWGRTAKGEGLNRLGEMLEEIREELRMNCEK